MNTKNIDELVSKTSDLLGVPAWKVRECAKYQFKALRQWAKRPVKAGFRIPEIGRWYFKHTGVRRKLKRILEDLREDPNNEDLKEEFRFW